MLVVPSPIQPGPRKSAIRALPPQIFASPPRNIVTKAIIKAAAPTREDDVAAFGGAELMELMKSVNDATDIEKDEVVEILNNESSMATPLLGVASIGVTSMKDEDDNDNTVARKKRRVTFNPYQEKT
jgi:hypothetical protein